MLLIVRVYLLCNFFVATLRCQEFLSSQSMSLFQQNTQLKRAAIANRHTVPLHRQRVPVQSDDGIVSFKSVYFGTIFLGSPKAQEFTVVFDTGSGHAIVPSVYCKSETCMMHRQYDHRLSETATPVDYDGTPILPGAPRDQVTVAFGTGEVTGQFAQERLCVGLGRISQKNHSGSDDKRSSGQDTAKHEEAKVDMSPECIDMRVIMATEMSEEPFSSFAFDGVLGLGLDALALAPEFSFFGMMAEHGSLTQPIFGAFLADNDNDFSEISVGGHNPDRIASDISWAQIAMPEMGYWQISILAVRVGNVTLDFCADGTCRAVVDTGTSLIAVPSDFKGTLQDSLQKSLRDPTQTRKGGADCSDAEGPLLEFDIEGATLSLGPGDYARPSVQMLGDDEDSAAAATATLNGNGGTKGPGRSADGDGSEGIAGSGAEVDAAQEAQEQQQHKAKCHPTLMAIDLPEPLGPKLFIWGEPLLRKYYSVYDWGQKRVGFALARQQEQDPLDKHDDEEESDEEEEEEDNVPPPTRKPLLIL